MGYELHGLRSAQLLNQLGLDGGHVVDQLQSGRSPAELANLDRGYTNVSGFGPQRVSELLRTGLIAPSRLAPVNRQLSPSGYAPQNMPAWNSNAGSALNRFLAADPFARQQLEMALGGRIVPQAGNPGQLQVVPFPPGSAPTVGNGGPNGATATAQSMLAGFAPFATGGGNPNLFSPADFLPGMGNGNPNASLNNLFAPSALQANGFAPGGSGYGNAIANGLGNVAGGGGGGGFGGVGAGGSAAGVLSDPTLTVEDKITLMLMIIMKQMDKQIEQQANYINSLQQQQGGGGKGGGAGGKGGGSSPSIDVETMKLKRMIDKRSQMFDMLRQIIDKYNETAKNIIQSIGR